MGGQGSGRPQKEVDIMTALDLISRGESIPTISTELGISPPTLRARIADLSKKQGLLLQYRSVQSLQLTELQARVLEAITPEKINEAPLRDLVASYKILKDKELNIEGKPSEIKGLVAHLIYLEKQEAAVKSGLPSPEETTDAEYDDIPRGGNGDGNEDVPVFGLSELDDQRF